MNSWLYPYHLDYTREVWEDSGKMDVLYIDSLGNEITVPCFWWGDDHGEKGVYDFRVEVPRKYESVLDELRICVEETLMDQYSKVGDVFIHFYGNQNPNMTYELKVEKASVGYIAYEKDACLCPECRAHAFGGTIQNAIDNILEKLQEERAAKADPNDPNFTYNLNYKWS